MNRGTKAVLIFGAVVAATVGGTVAYRVFDKPVEVAQVAAPASLQPSAVADAMVRRGSFVDVDSVHKGSGQAVVSQTAAGPVLRLENFKVTEGPDLYVYLTKNGNVEQDKKPGDFVSLGRLKSNEGDQTYTLPPDFADYRGVLVWCRAFAQPFTAAALR